MPISKPPGCLANLQVKVPIEHPNQMLKPPKLAHSLREQQLYSVLRLLPELLILFLR